ncbi:hypothetical protein B0H11DRAFT_1909799 [Mycena galericulata]|nr:hypothetical protein B0H11DRAFT_1909799 [Mycena galericulata]
MSNDLAAEGDGITALIFATGHRTPVWVIVPLKTLAIGGKVLDFDSHLYGMAAETDNNDLAILPISIVVPIRIDSYYPIFVGRSMKVIHLDRGLAVYEVSYVEFKVVMCWLWLEARSEASQAMVSRPDSWHELALVSGFRFAKPSQAMKPGLSRGCNLWL